MFPRPSLLSVELIHDNFLFYGLDVDFEMDLIGQRLLHLFTARWSQRRGFNLIGIWFDSLSLDGTLD